MFRPETERCDDKAAGVTEVKKRSRMEVCGYCKAKAEWRRYKDGWGFLACAEWFTGACEGDPLDVNPPLVGDGRPIGRGLEEDERSHTWLTTQLRDIWPLDLGHD